MGKDFGDVPVGAVLPIFWTTHDGATGANETMSALAVGDILVYKGVSMTQRASTSGYTLLDTDGIDVDGLTGVNAISIDLSDNADAGFYAAGSFYTVIVGPITVDGQTIYTERATFYISTHNANVDAILVDTNELQTDWANGGRLDLLIDAIKAATDLLNAAQAEPTGIPAVNETPMDKLAYLFAALRNAVLVTATKKQFFDDAGVAMWEKDLTDDGTTYTESESNAP